MTGPVGTGRDGRVDEIELHRVEALVCDACLDGEPSECHSPGCAFWCCPSINGEQGERLRNFVVEPRPVVSLPACDDLPEEAVEAGSWAETFELGRVGYKVAEAVLREAWPSLRAQIEARVREQVASEIEALREAHFADYSDEPIARGEDWGYTRAADAARGESS